MAAKVPLVATGVAFLILGFVARELVAPRPEPPADPSGPALAALRRDLDAARAETEQLRGKLAKVAAPPLPAPTEAAAPDPLVLEGDDPSAPLETRLAWFLKLLRSLDDEEKALDPKDGKASGSYWTRRMELVHLAQNELHTAVIKDPAAFITFLRALGNREHLRAVLGTLNPPRKFGEGYIHTPIAFEDYPADLTSGLESILRSGGPEQKTAVLNAAGNMTQLPERFSEIVEGLVTDPSDAVKNEAIELIERRNDHKLPERLLPILTRLLETSSDADVLYSGFQTLGRNATPEMQESLAERLSTNRDPVVVRNLVNALSQARPRMDAAMTDRYATALSSAVMTMNDEVGFRVIISASLHLSPAQMLRILGAARNRAPTPKQNEATERLIAALKGGERRWDALRLALKGDEDD